MLLATPRPPHSNSTIGVILALSILVHLPLLLGVSKTLLADQEPIEPRAKTASAPMRVRIINDPSLLAELEETTRSELEKPDDPEEEPEEEKPREVEQLPYRPSKDPVLEQTPDQARFSGRTSTRAERDVMKYGTEGSPNPSATPRQKVETTPALRPSDAPRRRTQKAERADPSDSTLTPRPEPEDTQRTQRATEREDELEAPFAEPDIILPSAARKRSARAAEDSGQERTQDGLARGELNAKDLFPSASAAATSSTQLGNQGTFDFMKEVEEGDRTMLNRKRNRYWTFYDRMQRQLKREWSPQRELRKRDPFGTVYGVGTFYTVVDMTLNADGSVRKLELARSCGLSFLDDEAMRALNAAGPFPNPPEGMKDQAGLIHIKFGFALEVVSGRVRFFRARPEKIF